MPQPSTLSDLVAAIWFMVAWLGYGLALESPRLNARSLNGRMDPFRFLWMERMADRDLRIVDTAIIASLLIEATPFRAGDPQILAWRTERPPRARCWARISTAANGGLSWLVRRPLCLYGDYGGVLAMMCRRQFGRLSLNEGASPP